VTDTAVVEKKLTARPTTAMVEAISALLHEPDWLRDHRLAALARYEASQWPRDIDRTWRRTPLKAAPLEAWQLPDGAGSAPAGLAALAGSERGGVITHVDGGAVDQELAEELATKGVLLLPLSEAARDHEALVRPHLNSVAPLDDPTPGNARFGALSAALWTQGVFVYIPRDVVVDETLYHLMSKTTRGAGIFGHSLIVVEAGAMVTVVEAALSDSPAEDTAEPSLALRTVEVIAGDGAQVKIVGLNRWGNDVHAFTTVRGSLGRGTQVTAGSAVFGGRLHREEISFEVGQAGSSPTSGAADGSHLELLGVFVGSGRQHIEHNTYQVHDAPGGTSALTIKGALDDDSTAVQYGTIRITPNGQRTTSEQTMRDLLLSDGASAEPIPILEIEADDVKCAHAAAVGPVTPEHLFYLESRGIDPPTAERMVVQGFLTELVDQFPDTHTREIITGLVDTHLQDERDSQSD
jgi:Fe-S cluster assembly protein SufD